MLAYEWIIVFLSLGACVGFVAGLLGVGGGGIMVPALTTIFLMQGVAVGQVVHLALGTSMACIIVTSIASLRAHHKKDAVIWPIVKSMSAGIIIGTFLATFIASYLNSLYLAIIFFAFMGTMAIKMFQHKEVEHTNKTLTKTSLMAASTGIGAMSALVSIGGGSLTVPYLVANNIDFKKAIGTSAAIGLPISVAGTVGYAINGWGTEVITEFALGYVYLPAVILISITSFFTAPYGVRAAHYLPVKILKKIFGVLLVLLSIKMLYSVI